MKRCLDDVYSITPLPNNTYNKILKQLMVIPSFYEFYLKILSTFSNSLVSEFIKDYKANLVRDFPKYNFSFIKIDKTKKDMVHTIQQISDFIIKSPDMQNYNIYKSFLDDKIICCINKDRFDDILLIIINNISSIFSIFEILKIAFLKNNLVIYSNTINNKKKKGKSKNKNDSVKLINCNNQWDNYIDFLSKGNNSILMVIKLYNNHQLKQIFSDFQLYNNITNNKITLNKLKTTNKIKNKYFKHWYSVLMKRKHYDYKLLWGIDDNFHTLPTENLDNKLSEMIDYIHLN